MTKLRKERDSENCGLLLCKSFTFEMETSYFYRIPVAVVYYLNRGTYVRDYCDRWYIETQSIVFDLRCFEMRYRLTHKDQWNRICLLVWWTKSVLNFNLVSPWQSLISRQMVITYFRTLQRLLLLTLLCRNIEMCKNI